MHAGRHYTFRECVHWTRRETLVFALLAVGPLLLEHFFGVTLPAVSWAPIASLGVAVAFVTGFRTNAAYGRVWEARKIWGGILNTSRTWALLVRDFLPDDRRAERDALVRRHLAWVTCLRFTLRQPRPWESQDSAANREFRARTYVTPECSSVQAHEIDQWVPVAERERAFGAPNPALGFLSMQSEVLRKLAGDGALDTYRHVELSRRLGRLVDEQGRAERIKNFPYPRQFATLNRIFIWMFIVMLPFGLRPSLEDPTWVWVFNAVMIVLIAWVFHTMDKIGTTSENPFEGGPNDVPITAMSRGIERDVLGVMGESELPEVPEPVRNILM